MNTRNVKVLTVMTVFNIVYH